MPEGLFMLKMKSGDWQSHLPHGDSFYSCWTAHPQQAVAGQKTPTEWRMPIYCHYYIKEGINSALRKKSWWLCEFWSQHVWAEKWTCSSGLVDRFGGLVSYFQSDLGEIKTASDIIPYCDWSGLFAVANVTLSLKHPAARTNDYSQYSLPRTISGLTEVNRKDPPFISDCPFY